MTTAIVLGTAACVHDDFKAALAMFTPDFIVGVNHAGIDFEEATDWASCHIESMPDWLEQRRTKGFADPQLWTDSGKPSSLPPPFNKMGFQFAVYHEGSSGQLGISVAQTKGADRIVLCGIPLTNSPHYYGGDDFQYEAQYQNQWVRIWGDWQDSVKSCSGWTKEVLGYPTKKWLGVKTKSKAEDEDSIQDA